MIALANALDLKPTKLETPADKARRAVAQYRAQRNEDVYQALLGVIDSESANGAVGLSLYHYDVATSPFVEVRKTMGYYINALVEVHINVASLVDSELLAKRLESDGFTINTMDSGSYGKVIDSISWE